MKNNQTQILKRWFKENLFLTQKHKNKNTKQKYDKNITCIIICSKVVLRTPLEFSLPLIR